MKNIKYTNVRKLASLHRHRFQLSNDLLIDANSAKNVFDFLEPGFGNRFLKGFIQEIHSNPFGALLMSELQVIFYFRIFSNDYSSNIKIY